MDSAIGQSGHDSLAGRYPNGLARACDHDVEFGIAAVIPLLCAEVLPVYRVFTPALCQCGIDDRVRERFTAAHIQVRVGIVSVEKRGHIVPLVLLVVREVKERAAGE